MFDFIEQTSGYIHILSFDENFNFHSILYSTHYDDFFLFKSKPFIPLFQTQKLTKYF